MIASTAVVADYAGLGPQLLLSRSLTWRNSLCPRWKMSAEDGWVSRQGGQGWDAVLVASMSSMLTAGAVASRSTELRRAGITWGCMGTTWPRGSNPAQGAHGVNCGSGEVFRMPFSQAWVPGQALSRRQGRGNPRQTYSDFLQMLKLGQLNPSPRDQLIKQHRKLSVSKLKIASTEDPGRRTSCTEP